MANTKSRSASRPNADTKRQPGQPRYQPVEQADDEEIAQSQRQGKTNNPADNVPRGAQVSGEDHVSEDISEDVDEEEWMAESDNDLSPEELEAEEDAREVSGGHRSQPTRRTNSPRP
jgi:hypothetical protein